MRAPLALSTEIETFQSAGVVCLRKVLDPKLVESLGSALTGLTVKIEESATGYDLTSLRRQIFGSEDIVQTHGTARQHDVSTLAAFIRASNHPALLDSVGSDQEEGRFTLDTTTWRRNAVVRSIALDSSLPRIASELLGAHKVNFCDDQIFVKAPHTAERTAFHQDLGYFHLSGTQGCVVWICADAAGPEAGVPVYLRGSHLSGVEYAPNVFISQTTLPGSSGASLGAIERDFAQYDPISFEVEPGDVIVHHFLTVHGASGNHTDHARRALSLRYVGESVKFKTRAGAPAQPYHEHELRDGDDLDSRQHPVVWPKPYPEFELAPLYS